MVGDPSDRQEIDIDEAVKAICAAVASAIRADRAAAREDEDEKRRFDIERADRLRAEDLERQDKQRAEDRLWESSPTTRWWCEKIIGLLMIIVPMILAAKLSSDSSAAKTAAPLQKELSENKQVLNRQEEELVTTRAKVWNLEQTPTTLRLVTKEYLDAKKDKMAEAGGSGPLVVEEADVEAIRAEAMRRMMAEAEKEFGSALNPAIAPTSVEQQIRATAPDLPYRVEMPSRGNRGG